MNKILTAVTALTLLAVPAALAESKSYKAKAFSRIEVDSAMSVVYKTGPETRIVVENSEGDFSDVYIANKGDALKVSRVSVKERGWFSWGVRSVNISDDGKTVKVNGKKVPNYTVYVTSPELEGVSASSSSRFESQTISGADFAAQSSSSARIRLAGNVSSASLSASSSGDIDAAGLAAGTLDVSASSSGDVVASVNGTGDSSVNASSSGDVTLKSAAGTNLVVDASSGSSVELSGNCERATVSASSGASVAGTALRCAGVNVSASSGASVDAFATGQVTASASSGANIAISGKPAEQTVSKSSGGSVDFTS
jgi:hypothetical protein